MIRLLTGRARIGLGVAAMAVAGAMVAFAQTTEPAIESVPASDQPAALNSSPTGDRTGANNDTSVQRNSPTNSAVPAAAEADNQSRIDELRRDILDDRAKYIDRWLSVIGIVLTFFGVVIAIAGIWAFGRFRKIEAEAKNTLEEIKKTRDKSLDIYQDLTGEGVLSGHLGGQILINVAAKNPAEANQAVKDTRENPEASLTEKAIADAVSLQQQERRCN